MSKYGKLAHSIRASILDGTYPQGSRLPTIPDLCRIYEVSNTTVKHALDELEADGFVSRRRGSGIYVKRSQALPGSDYASWSMSGQMSGLTAEFSVVGKEVTSDIKRFSIVHPDDETANALNIRPETFVYDICRVRIVEDVPQNVEYTKMPLNVIPGLLEKHLHGSIYGYIERDLGLRIDSAHRILHAVLPTEEEASWLRIAPTMPLLEVTQVAYLDDGTPFEYSTTHHTPNYEFKLVSTH